MKGTVSNVWVGAAGFVLVWGFCAGADAADSLDQIIAPGTETQVLGTGYGFCEGPAADAEGNVYFSDGKNDTIHFYKVGRPVVPFVTDALDANGMMFNARGELVVCQGAAFKVVAFDVKTGKKRVLAEKIEGGRFNEPNDLTIDRHGGFYFTDPNYRHRKQETVRKEDAYYCSADGKISRVSTVCTKPNGILLTADDKTLYLADNAGRCIYKYDVLGPGKLADETKWLDLGTHPDGMTLDEQGNLYVCCNRGGVKVYTSAGKPIGTIELAASNACFGGPEFKTLYLTCRDRFVGIRTKVAGLKPLPLRGKGRGER